MLRNRSIMQVNNLLLLSKYKQIFAIILINVFGMVQQAQAMDINADVVMNTMNSDQRIGYVSGVIEGLAYSRFVRDKPNEAGMKCIYDWYYGDNDKRWKETLFPAFTKHGDKPVGVILYVLTKNECGV